MKVAHGNRIVDVWQISHDLVKEDWVTATFKSKNLSWNQVNLDIILLNAPWSVVPGKLAILLLWMKKIWYFLTNNSLKRGMY